MDSSATNRIAPERQGLLLTTLERLLALEATEIGSALQQAAQFVAEALAADKVDVFVRDPASETLVAMGTSNTPMGRKQHALGLHLLPIANGGRAVHVFENGQPFHSGQLDRDPEELLGIKQALGVRSMIALPLEVNGERRGVLSATSAEAERFTEEDLQFLKAVSHWVALTMHRAELVERIAQDAAEQARRATANELLTMLAHDLRAPLTPVVGYLSLMRQEAERQGHQLYLRYTAGAQRGLDRLQRMLSNMLDTTRLEQGIFALESTSVDLVALVEETAATLRTPAMPIEVRTLETLVGMADPSQLRRALENLISNAQRHSPEGLPVLVALAIDRRQDGEWAVIDVRDEGPGISQELLPRLFTRFSAGGQTAGLGLGLYLARGVAEAHGGTLTVESPPGSGACFRLALPLTPPLS